MPKQNRVTPLGELIATSERGTFMGNRGVLHDAQGRIQRAWQVKRWITCLLAFRGRQRQVMTPGWYTELFFLDEATAFAAGHRPCAECRRERFNAFRQAWRTAHGSLPSAVEMDQQLHEERVNPDRTKRHFTANLDTLPNGGFVRLTEGDEQTYLVLGDGLLAWTPGGYAARISRPNRIEVCVLTPRSTLETIRAGYTPEIHPSASVLPV